MNVTVTVPESSMIDAISTSDKGLVIDFKSGESYTYRMSLGVQQYNIGTLLADYIPDGDYISVDVWFKSRIKGEYEIVDDPANDRLDRIQEALDNIKLLLSEIKGA